MEGLSPSDIALMQKDTTGCGGGSFLWIFALIILVFCFGGIGFGGRQPMPQEQPVTETALCNAMNFNGLENNVGRAIDKIDNAYTGLQNGLSNFGYETLTHFNDVQRQISEVGCTVIGQSAEIQKTSTANTQKILDAITGNRIAEMQNQINALQLQSAMCGVVRYPTQTSYCSGVNPFAGGCCSQVNI